MDKTAYIQYIKHLEPHLGPSRPVCIFQDNLSSHESFELVEFCVKHGILLYNFPSKVSHLIQPLDKLFNLVKTKFNQKRADANLMQQQFVSNAKIPVVFRFAMEAVSTNTIQEAFEVTGIYPLNRRAITDDLLVGTDPVPMETESQPSATPVVPETSMPNLMLSLQVFDENNESLESDTRSRYVEKEIQTDKLTSLPCEICIRNDVRVHPAVASGAVDFALASVFIPDTVSRKETTKRRISRDCSKGRCLTSETEFERLRNEQEETLQKEQAKKQRIEQRQKNREMRHEQENCKKMQKEKNEQLKPRMKELEANMTGKLHRRTCTSCGEKIKSESIAKCVLCNIKLHKNCINEESFVTVCYVCSNQ